MPFLPVLVDLMIFNKVNHEFLSIIPVIMSYSIPLDKVYIKHERFYLSKKSNSI